MAKTSLQEKVINIPSALTRGESLIVIPQKAYKEFLKWRRRLEWKKKTLINL